MPETSQDRLRAALIHSLDEQRLRAVLHRWYSFYENEANRNLTHHGELVTDDFALVRPPDSPLPSTTGRQAYLDSLATAHPGQYNSHQLQTLQLTRTGAAALTGTCTHTFQTHGPHLGGAALIGYTFDVVQEPHERLPRLARLREHIIETRQDPFQEGYITNRTRAFAHYWLSLLERPADTAGPLLALLDDTFIMTMSDERTLTTRDDVAAWYADIRATAGISTHHITAWNLTPGRRGTHRLVMELRWQSITPDRQTVTTATRHRWTLRETGDRYLRLSDFHVARIRPLARVTAHEALGDYEDARTSAR
ncbi:hypothetical protein [Streptomyces spinoverrucosus]|nr:hypothetical protein [Streptomyces spinoverrucosus]